jgi:hypothetical protein
MSTQLKFRQDKGVSQADITPDKSNKNHKKVVASNADFFSEWAIEKCTIKIPKPKKGGNSAEPASDNTSQTTYYNQYY